MKDGDVGYLNHVRDTRILDPDRVCDDITQFRDNSNREYRQSSGVEVEETSSENDDGNGETSGRS